MFITMPCRSALLFMTCWLYLGLSQAAGSVGSAAAPHAAGFSGSGDRADASIAPVASVQLTQASAPSPSPILRVGSRGEPVKALQRRLQELGYYNGAIDGAYGSSTKDAVGAFQQAVGITIDGRVGTETQQRLRQAQAELPAEVPPSPTASPTPQPTTASERPSPTPAVIVSEVSSRPDAEAPEAEANAARQQTWRSWLLPGLGILAGIGGVLGYLIIHSRFLAAPASDSSAARSSDPSAAKRSETSATAGEPPIQAAVTETTLTEVTPSEATAPEHTPIENGSNRLALSEPSSPPVQETTRLFKIDIGEELLKDLHSPDSGQRRKAIWELGQRGDSGAIQPLVDLMMDSDSQQRSLILAAISEIGMRTLKPMNRALLISLQDESSDVRKNAIRDLTRIYDMVAQISQLLAHAVNDPDPDVQETAHWALGQLNRIRTVAGVDNSLMTNGANHPEYLPGDKSTSS
jgi:hypothetical protein